jgi:hypothetical protein
LGADRFEARYGESNAIRLAPPNDVAQYLGSGEVDIENARRLQDDQPGPRRRGPHGLTIVKQDFQIQVIDREIVEKRGREVPKNKIALPVAQGRQLWTQIIRSIIHVYDDARILRKDGSRIGVRWLAQCHAVGDREVARQARFQGWQ